MTERVLGGKYEVVRLVGEGGFSRVFEGVEVETGKKVAIKRYKLGVLNDEQLRDTVARHKQQVAVLEHLAAAPVLGLSHSAPLGTFLDLSSIDSRNFFTELHDYSRDVSTGEAGVDAEGSQS